MLASSEVVNYVPQIADTGRKMYLCVTFTYTNIISKLLTFSDCYLMLCFTVLEVQPTMFSSFDISYLCLNRIIK